MEIKETIGIDVSKETLDVHIHSKKKHCVFENSPKEIKEMINWALENSSFGKQETMFTFEHTGLYSHQLSATLSAQGMMYTAIPGLEIKRSLGLVRGKDDKVDSEKIALYAYRLREEIKPSQMPPKSFFPLKGFFQ